MVDTFSAPKLLLFFTLLTVSSILLFRPSDAKTSEGEWFRGAPEIGEVNWRRDFQAALDESKSSGKAVFTLFQEVPGCQGCKDFGQSVLREPLLVEAIENEFIPVLVFNNRGGKDDQLLKRFKEPAWNYQVIRFFNHLGEDVIPRKDRVWTVEALATRMLRVLQKHNGRTPEYLRSVLHSHSGKALSHTALSMFCYWTGERVLGKIEGVLRTEAGYFKGREVTRAWYDADEVDLESIIRKAKQHKCANEVFLGPEESQSLRSLRNKGVDVAEFDTAKYRKANAKDQKRQLQGLGRKTASLNEYQLMKVNAYWFDDRSKALMYLSPKQRHELLR